MKKPPKTSKSKETWYPSDAEFASFKPIAQVDPKLLAAHQQGTIVKRGRPKVAKPKEVVSVRLDPEVIASLRAHGRGWQTQLNAFLYDAIVHGKRVTFYRS
jgi:uncharacterized protein (DUF4415 family)